MAASRPSKKPARVPSIIEAMDDPALFGAHFQGPSWGPWRTFLKVAFGLPLNGQDLTLFRECTGRQTPPAEAISEWWCLVGRRGGKSLISSLCACWLAVLHDYRQFLAPGEVATVMLLGGDVKQAKLLRRYCSGLIHASPMLERRLINETNTTLEFQNRSVIEVNVASPRQTRGYTLAGVIADEIATWPSDETSPKRDEDVLAAVRPAMLTIPHAKLIAITSPYARKGAVWNAHRKHFGQDASKVLIWQAPTTVMNPAANQDAIAEAYADDPESAAAEFGAQFRRDIAAYLSQEILDACTMRGRHELPPLPGVRYKAFCDPSGGSSDSYCLAIAHKEGDCAVLDCLREARAPFSPADVTADFADTLKLYNVREVMGDRYAGEFPRELWRGHHIEYKLSERSKSDIYRELIPSLNAHRTELLDNRRLLSQLLGLERRTGRGTGRDVIDHAPNSHDDAANAACGALLECLTGKAPIKIHPSIVEAVRQGRGSRSTYGRAVVYCGGRWAPTNWRGS